MKYTFAFALLMASLHGFPQQLPDPQGWKKLTLREKIGQTMMMLPDHQKEIELGNGSLRRFFDRYPVSGFFMGWKLFTGISDADKVAELKKYAREYQSASKQPLIFQQDFENGTNLPGMTTMPVEMAIGAANSPQLSYNYGKAMAMESRSVGIQWVLHPVADLNINPLNPIMNIRSISDNPVKAIRLLSRQIKGLQDNGVAATIKHFPGDGVDFRDQHLVTTNNSLTLEEWKKYHGRVFQALIDSGVAAIMPGHITLPAYQKQKINGFFPPATLSKEILTNLLKNEMHFKGVIISDAMTMGGFRGWYPNQLEGEVASFAAGVDVLLWPSYAYMDTIEARIKRHEISIDRLNDAVSRIWALKIKFKSTIYSRQFITTMSPEDRVFAKMTSDSISAAAVTLVRDRNNTIPFGNNVKKILVVGVTTQSRKGGDGGLAILKNFADQLTLKGFTVDFQRNILYETQGWDEQVSKKYDKIIIAVVRRPHAPFGPLQFYDDEAQTAWAVNAMPKDKVIVVSFGSPYVINEYFERVNTCINAYSNNPETHNAVINVLLGQTKAKGLSPVNLQNNIFNKYKTVDY